MVPDSFYKYGVAGTSHRPEDDFGIYSGFKLAPCSYWFRTTPDVPMPTYFGDVNMELKQKPKKTEGRCPMSREFYLGFHVRPGKGDLP